MPASFAERVSAHTKGTGSSVSKLVKGLNQLPKKERAAIVAYLDNVPPGTQWTAVGRAVSEVFDENGVTFDGKAVTVNDDHVKRFALEGKRDGLEA